MPRVCTSNGRPPRRGSLWSMNISLSCWQNRGYLQIWWYCSAASRWGRDRQGRRRSAADLDSQLSRLDAAMQPTLRDCDAGFWWLAGRFGEAARLAGLALATQMAPPSSPEGKVAKCGRLWQHGICGPSVKTPFVPTPSERNGRRPAGAASWSWTMWVFFQLCMFKQRKKGENGYPV